jgi:hypothetical protein
MNKKGFSAVGIILAIVVIGFIGFVGYYVWSTSNNTAPETSGSTEDLQDPEQTVKKVDTPNGFVEYVNEELDFRFIYPEDWGSVVITAPSGVHSGEKHIISFSDTRNVYGAITTADFKPKEREQIFTFAGDRMYPSLERNREFYSQRFIVKESEGYFMGNTNSCEMSGSILLSLYVDKSDKYSLLQFTYSHMPENVQDLDCTAITEDTNLLKFFDEELVADFETIANYSKN